MNSIRNYALERTGKFEEARKREEIALKFWEACKWAYARELAGVTKRPDLCPTCGGHKLGPTCGQCG